MLSKIFLAGICIVLLAVFFGCLSGKPTGNTTVANSVPEIENAKGIAVVKTNGKPIIFKTVDSGGIPEIATINLNIPPASTNGTIPKYSIKTDGIENNAKLDDGKYESYAFNGNNPYYPSGSDDKAGNASNWKSFNVPLSSTVIITYVLLPLGYTKFKILKNGQEGQFITTGYLRLISSDKSQRNPTNPIQLTENQPLTIVGSVGDRIFYYPSNLQKTNAMGLVKIKAVGQTVNTATETTMNIPWKD